MKKVISLAFFSAIMLLIILGQKARSQNNAETAESPGAKKERQW